MLNKEHFILLAGNPRKWDDETYQRTRKESLVEVQRDQYDRGRRSAKLLQLISGWAVVDASGLNPELVLVKKLKTREEAIKIGKAWAVEEPDNREFFASKNDMGN